MSGERQGLTIWLTGLPAAGKTTVGDLVAAALQERGRIVERLDGDVVRRHLSAGLGYSREDRDTNVARIGWVASRLTRAGVAVVVSAIAPYAAARRQARALVEEHGTFVEVLRRRIGGGVCEARREGPVCTRVSRRDSRPHRRRRPLRDPRDARAPARHRGRDS